MNLVRAPFSLNLEQLLEASAIFMYILFTDQDIFCMNRIDHGIFFIGFSNIEGDYYEPQPLYVVNILNGSGLECAYIHPSFLRVESVYS